MPARRDLLATGLGLAGLIGARPLLAAEAVLTPWQTTGPFYPEELPLDADNDLVRVAGRDQPAEGVITHIFGEVLGRDGRPLGGAQVEIWQCDAQGRYHHPRDRGGQADPNFQGYGTMTTGADAAFRFRTIRPVAYPGRTPHIHFAIRAPGMKPFSTQMYVEGEPLNARDGVLNRIRDPEARASVIVALRPAPELEVAALAGRFRIVVDHPGAA